MPKVVIVGCHFSSQFWSSTTCKKKYDLRIKEEWKMSGCENFCRKDNGVLIARWKWLVGTAPFHLKAFERHRSRCFRLRTHVLLDEVADWINNNKKKNIVVRVLDSDGVTESDSRQISSLQSRARPAEKSAVAPSRKCQSVTNWNRALHFAEFFVLFLLSTLSFDSERCYRDRILCYQTRLDYFERIS